MFIVFYFFIWDIYRATVLNNELAECLSSEETEKYLLYLLVIFVMDVIFTTNQIFHYIKNLAGKNEGQ